MSWRILNLAVCVLPREERRRYLDEYASELHDLTQVEGLSGRTQIGYALRLLARTPALVFVLRSSASQASQRRIHAESSPYRVENT
ncbi:hypothetical protein [Amycolatopsis alba]|nr:hypothetical protein [Amycolatopsis alba]